MIRRELNRMYRDERGAVVVMIGALIAFLLVFAVYAIDASQMLLVRTQLQNAADAAALAGALVGGMTGDTTLAQNEAILAAGANNALVDSGNGNIMDPVVITDADVVFPQARRIEVTTHRTEATGDPFMNYFLRIFDDGNVAGEMTARAAAEFFWVCSGKCIEPWAPPDRWYDANANDAFDPDSITNPDEYYDPLTTGYTDADLGEQITIVLANGGQTDFGEFWYYSVCLPPVNKGNPDCGGDTYRDWMCEGCLDSSFTVEPGDTLLVEPGKKTGPNDDGLDCIIATDPDATWDDATGTVVNSAFPISPRIVKAAFFNPAIGLTDAGNGRKRMEVAKIFVLFVEGSSGGDQITGRFMRLNEPGGEVCADQSDPTFLYTTRLIE